MLIPVHLDVCQEPGTNAEVIVLHVDSCKAKLNVDTVMEKFPEHKLASTIPYVGFRGT